MILLRIGLVLGGTAIVAGCASRPAPAPAPAPASPPVVQAPAPPPAPPAASDWQDAPLAPGDWSFGQDGGISTARYGPAGAPTFVVRCEPGRQVSLTRTDAAAATSLTLRTSSTARTLPARGSMALVPASDPLLDAIVFSRGRFAVEVPGQAALIVPAWPEAARVVEDCRS